PPAQSRTDRLLAWRCRPALARFARAPGQAMSPPPPVRNSRQKHRRVPPGNRVPTRATAGRRKRFGEIWRTWARRVVAATMRVKVDLVHFPPRRRALLNAEKVYAALTCSYWQSAERRLILKADL